jgi:hypothetical protein
MVFLLRAKFQILRLIWVPEGFGHIQLMGQEVIFNRSGSISANRFLPE